MRIYDMFMFCMVMYEQSCSVAVFFYDLTVPNSAMTRPPCGKCILGLSNINNFADFTLCGINTKFRAYEVLLEKNLFSLLCFDSINWRYHLILNKSDYQNTLSNYHKKRIYYTDATNLHCFFG